MNFGREAMLVKQNYMTFAGLPEDIKTILPVSVM
jgi:hypothetical protein